MKDILGRDEAVTVEHALKILMSLKLNPPLSEITEIEDSYGRVLANDIVSSENLPGFNRSTMDGYAVNSSETFGASDTMPVYLAIKGGVAMGKVPGFSLYQGEVAVIPTGGMLPEGADAVVMFEHTSTIDEDGIEVIKAVAPGENVIRFDEDVKAGDVVFKDGHRLRPQDIGALAGIGVTKIEVYKKPVITIISTGNEVVPPDKPLSIGEVRDINSYNLAGLIRDNGGIPLKKGIISDEMNELRKVIRKAVEESQMVLITGSSSVGVRDYASKVIDELGNPGVLFHGVTIKPGKPLIGGLINGIPIFGLPGHPAAVTVCFENFVEPILMKLTGEITKPFLPRRKTVKAIFSRNLSSPSGREEHIRVALEKRDDGIFAIPILGKSGLIRTLIDADGEVIIPLHKTGIYEGEEVKVRLFND